MAVHDGADSADMVRPSCRTWRELVDPIHKADRIFRDAIARSLLGADVYVFRSLQDRAELQQFWKEMGLDPELLARIGHRAYGMSVDPLSRLLDEIDE